MLRPQVSTCADEQHVIAGAMPRVVAAFEPCDAAVDQRDAGAAQPIVDALEAVRVRPRKPAREIDLVVRQHVDRVVLGALQRREALRAPVEAPHDERRVERHRVERVRREADEPVVRARRADDGDARGELREGIAKLALGERGSARGAGAVGGGGGQCVAGGKGPMVAAALGMGHRRPTREGLAVRPANRPQPC